MMSLVFFTHTYGEKICITPSIVFNVRKLVLQIIFSVVVVVVAVVQLQKIIKIFELASSNGCAALEKP